MSRLTHEVISEVRKVRDKFGESEYDRDQLLPAVIGILRKHVLQDELLLDRARSLLDSFDQSDDKALQGMFPYAAHVALGERKRIQRGSMNLGQLNRRKRIIDGNKTAQDISWSTETRWINERVDLLEGRPPETKVADVLSEDGRKEDLA